MNSMILGRYVPGNSILHRMDPRAKLLGLFLLIVILFWANNVLTNALLSLSLLSPHSFSCLRRLAVRPYFNFIF